MYAIRSYYALAGYDNIDASQYFRVPLTTVSQNFFEMGQMAAQVLVSRMKEQDSPGCMKLQQRIEPELVIRDSVKKLYDVKGGTRTASKTAENL